MKEYGYGPRFRSNATYTGPGTPWANEMKFGMNHAQIRIYTTKFNV